MKKPFIHGISTGALAAIAAIIYNNAYTNALVVDFSKIINLGGLIGSSLFGGIIASLGYFAFQKWIKNYTDVIFNIIFVILTFASLIGSFATNLPTDIEAPELFIGLSVPMHFFPIIFWLATKPLFYKNNN